MDSTTTASCSCRKGGYHYPFTTRNLLFLLLLFIPLPLLSNKNIVGVLAAPYPHQSDSISSLPESAALMDKALVSSNAINSTILLEMQHLNAALKNNNALYSSSSTALPSSVSYEEHHGSRALKKAWLSNRSIVCNDGTAAGFYLRKNPNSKKWIVFLEGGWHCYDVKSCRTRWNKLRHLMTSTGWPETRDGNRYYNIKKKIITYLSSYLVYSWWYFICLARRKSLLA